MNYFNRLSFRLELQLIRHLLVITCNDGFQYTMIVPSILPTAIRTLSLIVIMFGDEDSWAVDLTTSSTLADLSHAPRP